VLEVMCDGEMGEVGGENVCDDDGTANFPLTDVCACKPLPLWAATRLDRLGVNGVHSSSCGPNLGAGGVCSRRELGGVSAIWSL
jgi:hypothetical protein